MENGIVEFIFASVKGVHEWIEFFSFFVVFVGKEAVTESDGLL